jgi:hypothetical protein
MNREEALIRLALTFTLMLLIGCDGQRPATPKQVETEAVPLQFVDVTEETGFHAPYDNGRDQGNYAILESLGGGCGARDFDGDGLCDVFAPGGGGFTDDKQIFGRNSTLNRQLPGNRRATTAEGPPGFRFNEVAAVAGCQTSRHYSHGCAVSDIDNDGFPDLLMTGYGGLQFFRNLGDGTFEECAMDSGLTDTLWSSSAGWGDVNGDGLADLYVAHYANWSFANHPNCPGSGPDGRDVCPPREFEALDDVLYLNQGDGQFIDATSSCGLIPGGKGLGVIVADLDDDNDLDIYVANDTTPNFLYRNDGTGTFTEIGLSSGTALDDRGVPNGSMGTSLADFDGDGRNDIWVTNFEMETFALYRNLGDCQFQHLSRDSGVNAIGSRFVGFGTVTNDFDLDGDPDIAVANGHVVYYPPSSTEAQAPVYLENLGGGKFRRQIPGPTGGYFESDHVGRGMVTADFDQDGRADVIATHLRSPASLLRNSGAVVLKSLRLQLVGDGSGRDATGTTVTLLADKFRSVRHLYGGGSYLCASEHDLTWGLSPDVEVVELLIHWPSGTEQEFTLKCDPKTTVLILESATEVSSLSLSTENSQIPD